VFVAVLSSGALSSMNSLQERSRVDNVVLEHRLALELREFGLISLVFPLMVGDPAQEEEKTGEDKEDEKQYGPKLERFSCWGAGSDAVVSSIEAKLQGHVANQSLGLPLRNPEG
jgi:hypothetical protein